MELSINTLVVLILGIVILGGGFAITKSLTDTSQDILEFVDESAQQKIHAIFAKGELIAVPENVRTGFPGDYVFALGFVNKLQGERTFIPQVEPLRLILPNGDFGNVNTMPEPFMSNVGTGITLQANEEKSMPVSITFPKDAQRGTYEYNVSVQYADGATRQPYGQEKRIRITIR